MIGLHNVPSLYSMGWGVSVINTPRVDEYKSLLNGCRINSSSQTYLHYTEENRDLQAEKPGFGRINQNGKGLI